MMTKIRSIQDSWLAKGILILTALSFMSLFGVSGYLGGAGRNRPIIRVDDIIIYQDEINNQYNQELQTTKSLFGDNIDVNDSMKNAILQNIVQKNLINAIMKKTTDDLDVSISDDLVRKIIYSQAEFMDNNGIFSLEKFRRLLSISGWSEQRYIDTLRQDIIKQHLVQNPVENINIPQFMTKYLTQLENQKKVFKYIVINPATLKTDRKISQEEVEQYYQDFAMQFEEPEKRDVSYIELTTEKLAAKAVPSEEEIKTYYESNLSQFVIPEQRQVLQMVFENQDDANKAMAALDAGGDFYNVAKEFADQDKAATDLGAVSKDSLIADMGDAVFELKKGGYTSPIKSEFGWHIMKVTGITPKKETKLAEARAKISAAISKEKAYDEASAAVAEIEDKLGAGASLEEIAEDYKASIRSIKGLSEDGKAAVSAPADRTLLASSDFIDTAFSYNSGEISQVLEEDEGFVIVRVDNIVDAHPKALNEVRGEIEKMWTANEKNAIAQEIVNDVNHDLENGDNISEIARRFNLNIKETKPLKRNESFAGLSPMQMNELFQEGLGEAKILTHDEQIMIIVPVKVVKAGENISKEETDVLRSKAKADMSQTAANELIDAYGRNYKVRVKYKYLGLTD